MQDKCTQCELNSYDILRLNELIVQQKRTIESQRVLLADIKTAIQVLKRLT